MTPPDNPRQVYCLFCETGREPRVETLLRDLGHDIIPQSAEYRVVRRGARLREWRRLLPGYVLFTAAPAPDWKRLARLDHVYRPLGSGGPRPLRGADLDFVRWLLRRASGIGLSRAVREGTKIRVTSGPLLDYAGSIVKINLRRECAQVEISTDGVIRRVWLGFELMEEAAGPLRVP